jgi:signal transduction histidine kinase
MNRLKGMSSSFRDMPLKRALRLVILCTSTAALLLATIAFGAYEWISMKNNLVTELSAHAQIIGNNSRAAMLFNDKESAARTLETLVVDPAIVSAILYNASGEAFASYFRSAETNRNVPARPTIVAGHNFLPNQLELASMIKKENETIGTIVLRSDLSQMYAGIFFFARIVLLVIFLSTLGALFIGSRLQRLVSDPILKLTDAARRVSKERDYSIRVEQTLHNEIGLLTQNFNQMLAEIQLRAASAHTYAEKLERSNRDLQDFAYLCSHDLQEPLRKIQAFGDRIKDKYQANLGQEGTDFLLRMLDAASRMQILINDLLQYSRVATKSQPFAPVNLDKIAREVLSDLEVAIERHKGRVDLVNLPTIEADALQMRQFFQNLVGNALKFHKENVPPIIRIEGTLSKEQVELVVSDNGIGFEEKYADKIFAIFQRLHGRAQYEGTGVGLAIVKKIVERHGGHIVAKGEPGQGASFITSLPIKHTSATAEKAN